MNNVAGIFPGEACKTVVCATMTIRLDRSSRSLGAKGVLSVTHAAQKEAGDRKSPAIYWASVLEENALAG